MTVPWIAVWQAVFLAGVVLFAGMSVWVTVQGWADVRSLFRALGGRGRRPHRGRRGQR